MRNCIRERATNETSVRVEVRLDERGTRAIATGLAIFDHFLEQLGFHGGFHLEVEARALDGIRHHLVEDVAIVLGGALAGALGDRRGIARYATVTLPMDDALIRVALDFGGRSYARVALDPPGGAVEGLEIALVRHFFSSLSAAAGCCTHVDLLAGDDPHHCVEAAFKAFGRACRAAWTVESGTLVPSTKGVL